jgi:hypothetical protein
MNWEKLFQKIAVLLLTFGVVGRLQAQSPVTISVEAGNPGAAIAPDFSGLSFEVSQLLPDEDGKYYFSPDNARLIHLFHTLGIKNLRIGGNTSDRDVRKLPEKADLDSLFAFAKVADIKVIYCLRLHNGDPQADAQTAKYIMDHYADEMDCFSIGQEPSAYPKMTNAVRSAEGMGAGFEKYSYADYARDWKRFADVIMAAVPGVKFCGPSVHNNGGWAQKFMADFGRSNQVALITEHLYPGGAGGKVPTPEIGRDRMLGDDFTRAYQKLYDGFVPAAMTNGLPYRLEEVNNYFNGGAKDVSNTFASALWGLDFMYWWGEHGAAGLNFHTGDKVAAGSALQASKYTAYYSTTNGYYVRPLGYGLKAFDLGSHGKFIPATVANADQLNLSVYAVMGDDKNVYLTIINKEHGATGRGANISITGNGVIFSYGQIISLTAPDNNVAATDGESLGGASIENDGSWSGSWREIPTKELGLLRVNVPAASAAVIKASAVIKLSGN